MSFLVTALFFLDEANIVSSVAWQTPWLIFRLNKCLMLRQATHMLPHCASYVNACAENKGWIYFLTHVSCSAIKSITIHEADAETYLIREMWQYKGRIRYCTPNHVSVQQVESESVIETKMSMPTGVYRAGRTRKKYVYGLLLLALRGIKR